MKKRVIVTTSWDDGHKLDLKLAKLLKKYKLKSTFYISLNAREFSKDQLLSDGEIMSLSKDFEIGAHTINHVNLTEVDNKIAEIEIEESKEYLESLTKKKVNSFCYPYGSFNNNTKKIVKNSGFLLARTTKRLNKVLVNDKDEVGTSVHAYTHLADLIDFKELFSNKTISWDKIARKKFDDVHENGGIFHLWGHSWEIEKFNAWEKLENVFKYISKRKGVLYVENKDLTK